jgi:hypothetical protein
LSLALGACGGDDDGDDDGGETVDPAGTNHTYVVSAIDLPENAQEAMQLGLDIDGKANDGVDNQLGMVLGSIGALAPDLDLQTSVDAQVADGGIILLVNMKATDLATARGVGMFVNLGTNPNPPACMDANDMVCGRHLAGGASFDLEAGENSDRYLAGRLDNGNFTGGPGNVTLQIALADGPAISLPLQRARATISGLSATGWTSGKIGGAISQDDINSEVIPAIADTVRASFDESCDVGGTPPNCGCVSGETGETLRGLFDKTPNDCNITDAEVMAVVAGFLTPDIDLNGDGTNDALSLGIGVEAAAATYTPPAFP